MGDEEKTIPHKDLHKKNLKKKLSKLKKSYMALKLLQFQNNYEHFYFKNSICKEGIKIQNEFENL